MDIGHRVILTLNAPSPGNYSQARVVEMGDQLIVYASGQTGSEPKFGQVVSGGIGPQTRQAIRNLEAVLKEVGGHLGHVVKTTVYLQHMAGDKAGFEAAYVAGFAGFPYPARSLVEVSQVPLHTEDSVVMIDAIAHVPKIPKKE